jgi:AAA domain-containing protein
MSSAEYIEDEPIYGASWPEAESQLESACAAIAAASEADQLSVLTQSARKMADVARLGMIERSTVADRLFQTAEIYIVPRLGVDPVQAALAEGLTAVRPPQGIRQGRSNDDDSEFRRSNDNHLSPETPRKQVSKWKQRTFTADALQTMAFPPLRFILPGLVPEGATLLVSRPKLGKSWLVLDLAIATAAGRFTLGELKPSSGAVLYLALEDGRRRLQRRIRRLLPAASWPSPLTIATEWPRADQGGLHDIEEWIKTTPDARMVIIDTLAQFRRPASGKSQVYAEDYQAISGLQKIASNYNIALIIVHHDRKSEADDVFDTVSGSLGLTGAADTILIMKRQSGAVILHVRGRDIEEAEKALQFDKGTCRWSILGEAADVTLSAERGRVLRALESAPDATLQAKDIQAAAELRNRNATDQLLYKMVRDGDIVRTGRGLYSLPDHLSSSEAGKIGKKERFGNQVTEIESKNGFLTNLTDLTGSGE